MSSTFTPFVISGIVVNILSSYQSLLKSKPISEFLSGSISTSSSSIFNIVSETCTYAWVNEQEAGVCEVLYLVLMNAEGSRSL